MRHWIGGLFAFGLLTLSCTTVSRAPLDRCPSEAAQRPAPTQECMDESVEYRMSAGRVVGKALMGWRSYPGYADFSIGFGPQANVESVCLRSGEGREVLKRVPQASHLLRRLGRAPRCFAGRRIEIEWESGDHTDHSIASHERACRREARKLLKSEEGCEIFFGLSTCDPSAQLLEQRDHEITQCVLRRAPLLVRVGGDGKIYDFLPKEDAEVTGELATQALKECNRHLPTREAATACMEKFGWVPSD